MHDRAFPIWTAFNQGEVSPLADGRVDQPGYFKACDKAENFIIRVQGPAERRPGTSYIGKVADHGYAGAMIPFRYSADVSFAIELGEYTARFFALGSRVVESELITNGTMEADANWSDVGSPTANARSSAQAHGGTYSRMFTVDDAGEGISGDVFTTTAGEHAVSLFVYSAETSVRIRIRKGDDSGWAYDSVYTIVPNVWHWINFTYTETGAGAAAYIDVTSPTGVTSGTWYVDDVTIRKIYQITTPWASSDLASLRFRQMGNVIYFTHPDYPVYKLTRVATASWTLSEVDFVWGPFLDRNETSTTIAPSALTGSGITLTASDNIFQAGHVGAQFKLTHDQTVDDDFSANGNGTAIEIGEGETFAIHLSGTWSGTMTLCRSFDGGTTYYDFVSYTTNTSLELVNLEADVLWCWKMASYSSGTATAQITVRDKSGYCKITAVPSPPATTATADVVEDFYSTDATDEWSEGAFSDERGFPRALSFFEGRLVLGSTENNPATEWGSKVDDYESHETGTADDMAWRYTNAGAEVNPMQWMLDGDVLHIGTSGDEWKFGDPKDATTPTAVWTKRQTAYGSANIEAVKAGDTVVFVEDGGRGLRAIGYNWESDKYLAPSLSDIAEHLFSSATVQGLVFTQRPISILWMWMSDGTIVAATFDSVEKVVAYHRHSIGGGFVESMCVARGEVYDEIYLIVRRTIDSQTVRYIERMQMGSWSDKEDAYFVDGGMSFSVFEPTRYFTGLYHMEGESVKVFADGAVHAAVTVTNGTATLGYAASDTVHIGKGFNSVLIPKRLELQVGAGQTTLSRNLSIPQCVIKLLNSMVCRVGTVEGQTDPIVFRSTLTPYGESPALFSGNKTVTVRGGGKDGRIVIECDEPAPLTVVAIMPICQLSTDT